MDKTIEQLSQIDWWSFLITLAIVISAYIAIKKGLEELSKHISWEPFWMKNERVHRELSEAVIAIKDELVGLKTDVTEVKNEVNASKENRCHDREDSQHIRAEMYHDLDTTASELRQELIDSVRSLSDKIDVLQQKIEDNELRKRIDGLRGAIISFATNLGNNQFHPSEDHYNSIFRKIEEYEEILETHGLENGQCSISIKIVEKHYAEDMENGLFLRQEEQ